MVLLVLACFKKNSATKGLPLKEKPFGAVQRNVKQHLSFQEFQENTEKKCAEEFKEKKGCFFSSERQPFETNLYHNDMILPLIYSSTLKIYIRGYIVVISLLYRCYIVLKRNTCFFQGAVSEKKNPENTKTAQQSFF